MERLSKSRFGLGEPPLPLQQNRYEKPILNELFLEILAAKVGQSSQHQGVVL